MSNYLDNKNLFMSPSVNQYGSHMVMTNVCKETKIKYLNLDTKYSDELYSLDNNNNILTTSGVINSNNTSNYNFTLPEKITDVKSIHLENIQFPLIQKGKNNKSKNQGYLSSNLGNNYFKISVYKTDIPEIENPEILFSKMIILPNGYYTTIKDDANKTTFYIIDKINIALNSGSLSTVINTPDQEGLNTLNLYFDIINNNVTYIFTDSYTYFTYVIDFAVDINGNFDKYNYKTNRNL